MSEPLAIGDVLIWDGRSPIDGAEVESHVILGGVEYLVTSQATYVVHAATHRIVSLVTTPAPAVPRVS